MSNVTKVKMYNFYFRLNRFRNEMLRNVSLQQQDQEGVNDAAGEGDQQEPAEAEPEPAAAAENNVVTQARTSKLVILKENTNAQEIKEKVDKTKACSL